MHLVRHFLDSLEILRQGRLQEGFAAYESRFQDCEYCDHNSLPQQGTWPLDVPRWDARTALNGMMILLGAWV